jgi:hypothetical protein
MHSPRLAPAVAILESSMDLTVRNFRLDASWAKHLATLTDTDQDKRLRLWPQTATE